MSGDDRSLERIVELLAGWLPPEERDAAEAELESRLGEEPALDLIRELAERYRRGETGPLTEHVHPQHLLAHLERPEEQSAELTAWIRDHLQSCAACREDLDTLRAVGTPALATADGALRAAGPRRPLALAAAALALGLVAGAGLLSVWSTSSLPQRGEVRPVTEITVGQRHVFRDGAGDEPRGPAPPLEIPRPRAGDGPIVLRLDTGLSRQALSAETGRFVVELRTAGRSWSLARRAEDFGPYGHVSLMLPAELAAATGPIDVSIRPPAGGEPVFSQSLQFVEDGARGK
jgi:hypothetical protein